MAMTYARSIALDLFAQYGDIEHVANSDDLINAKAGDDRDLGDAIFTEWDEISKGN